MSEKAIFSLHLCRLQGDACEDQIDAHISGGTERKY